MCGSGTRGYLQQLPLVCWCHFWGGSQQVMVQSQTHRVLCYTGHKRHCQQGNKEDPDCWWVQPGAAQYYRDAHDI